VLETPEQKARREIDADLTAAGWFVQNKDDLDLTAGRGIAVREFSLKFGFGFADYLLYLDRKAVGAVEAKAEGTLRALRHNQPSMALVSQITCQLINARFRSSLSPMGQSPISPMVSTRFRAVGKFSTSRNRRL